MSLLAIKHLSILSKIFRATLTSSIVLSDAIGLVDTFVLADAKRVGPVSLRLRVRVLTSLLKDCLGVLQAIVSAV